MLQYKQYIEPPYAAVFCLKVLLVKFTFIYDVVDERYKAPPL